MERILPHSDTYAPRDGHRLGRTSDWLFVLLLCRNLAANRHQYRMVMECREYNFLRRDKYAYLLEHYKGELHHPMTLERVVPWEVGVMNEIRPDTVLKTHCRPLIDYQLRVGLYEHLFVCTDSDELTANPFDSFNREPARLKIGRKVIWPSDKSRNSALSKLNAQLTWPIQLEDRILGGWQQRCRESTFLPPDCTSIAGDVPILSQLFGFDRQPRENYDALCPLDGYVKTIPAEFRSPGWTWSAKCGRQITMRICPHCLRIMRDELVALS